MLQERLSKFSNGEVYSAILIGVLTSSTITYLSDVTGIGILFTAFFSTIIAAGTFLTGLYYFHQNR